MKKIALLFLIVIFTAACALPSLGSLLPIEPTDALQYISPAPTESQPVIETPAPTESTQAPADAPSVGEEAAIKEIQQQVIELRGLQPKVDDLKDATLTQAQLADNVKNDFFKDYTEEDAKADVRELSAFGLLPAQFDIYKMYIDFYSEQIAGYYDPKTKDMYVVQGDRFTGTDKMTYAHEYTHALQDQNWDMENGLKSNDEYCKTHTEYCAGVQALVEGDASLTEQYWFFSDATEQDQQEVQDFYSDYSSPVYDSSPVFMQKDLMFPYDQGLNFVQYLYDGGGWAAVDKAYENPPSSTEMILHPEKYPADTQVDVPLKDVTSTLGEGWEETTRNSMGEWYLSLILSSGYNEADRLDEETAANAAAGWGGDTYTVNWNESTGQLAVIMRTRWDTSHDADEFWKALGDYGVKRWGNPAARTNNSISWENTADHYVRIYREGGDIWWILAPDSATADKIATAAK